MYGGIPGIPLVMFQVAMWLPPAGMSRYRSWQAPGDGEKSFAKYVFIPSG